MRRAAASLVAVASLVVLGAAGASTDLAQKRYVTVNVSAWFQYEVDRGTDGGIMGTYKWTAWYRLQTIAVFDGARLSSPAASIAVAKITVEDGRTKNVLVNGKWQEVPYCKDWEPGLISREVGSSDYRVSPGASVAIGGDGRLRVNPGSLANKKASACNESENLHTHGLTAGPSFGMPAPRPGLHRFTIRCVDGTAHGREHGVESFSGKVVLRIRVVPFEAARLGSRQERLRDLIGTHADPYNGANATGDPCL